VSDLYTPCECWKYWPGQGHPPDCPTQREVDTVKEGERMMGKVDEKVKAWRRQTLGWTWKLCKGKLYVSGDYGATWKPEVCIREAGGIIGQLLEKLYKQEAVLEQERAPRCRGSESPLRGEYSNPYLRQSQDPDSSCWRTSQGSPGVPRLVVERSYPDVLREIATNLEEFDAAHGWGDE